MNILIVNSGSSSIKYALFDTEKGELVFKRVVERVDNHQTAMEHLLDEVNVPVDGVGHRIVHGGEKLRTPTLITPAVIDEIKKAGGFVPLHCGPNLIAIESAQKKFPKIPHVAVFDTGIYGNFDYKTFLYAIPLEFYEKYKIRKYGFHGINHSYVAKKVASLLGKDTLKTITCHLGNGCSITAFENGIAIDTSMGLTPLEGVVMGSRSGDLDPSIILYLIDVLGLKTEEISDLLNKKSGLLGLCGKNDMRDIQQLAEKGDKWAQIAIEIFVYRIQKYVGAYIAALKGVDVIALTGGIGENDPIIREKILFNFGYIGAFVDKEKNGKNAPIFSTNDSKVTLMTIPANEELVIAEETQTFI